MAITITWKIDNLECQVHEGEFENVVYMIHWRVYASEGDANTSVYGSCVVSFTPSENFIPYEELTEEQVLSWTFASLGEEGKLSAEQSAISSLENILEPKVISKPLPWA